MEIITCLSQDAEKNAKKHNFLGRLQRLLHKISEDQSLNLLIPFSDKRFFKKRMGGSDYRVVFSHHIHYGEMGERPYSVLCAYQFYSRSSHDYEELWKKVGVNKDAREANAIFQKIATENEQRFVDCIREYRHNPLPPLPEEPNDQENLWLACAGKVLQQITVIESEKWIKTHKEDRFIRSSNAIHHVLETIYEEIDDACKYGEDENPYVNTSYLDGEDFRVHLQYFPDHQLLFLLDLTEKNVEKPALSFSPDESWEVLTQNARRAYPFDVFLLNSGDFAKIQGEEEGNLALSSEEVRILNHVHTVGNQRFPLFINGRAGSGKSTILQYLLKDYLYLAIEHWDLEKPYTPLYLTYSKKLLDSATVHLKSLLKNNAKLLLDKNEQWKKNFDKNQEDVFASTFKLFQSFMLELLPEKTRERFVLDKHIGYGQFKQLWRNSIARQGSLRSYSVDLVWHVIRTYIKGMSAGSNSYFTSEQYAALPDRYKSVDDQTFAEIYEKLWINWYKSYCDEHQCWDEQDLALTVLAEAEFPQCYPAIFCDEAQDFTVIELKILYYLSLFSERAVPDYNIGNVPFVFAGDPLQTLNPTGFRWEAVKSSFYTHLLEPIVKRTGKKTKADINYEELLSNYRSSKNIVDFCNTIQLLRLGLFNKAYQIQPQKTWFKDNQGMTPFIYDADSVHVNRLINRNNALVIIPNCHENEEARYVANDALLKAEVECDEEGVPSTVLSPSAAKGLEYDEIVVLYRFGATCPQSLLDRLQGRIKRDPGPSETIEWEYFLNRLYVAASRAKGRLVILDDMDTLQGFWGFMQSMDVELLNTQFGALINEESEWQGEELLAPKEGTLKDIDDLLQGRSSSDSRELANKYYHEGMDAENPGLLRRARLLYQRVNDVRKATECFAHALRLEEQYTRAANNYLLIEDHDAALDCFWKAANFTSISRENWCSDVASDPRVLVAQQLNYQKQVLTWVGSLAKTEKCLQRLEAAADILSIHVGNKGWVDSIKALYSWLQQNDQGGSRLKPYWGTVSYLAKHLEYSKDALANIAYQFELYQEAQRLWEEINKTGHKRYYRSLCESSNWPDTLLPLRELEEFPDIIRQWQDRGRQTDDLNEAQVSVVIEAMIRTNKLVKATRLLKDKALVKSPQQRKQLSKLLWHNIKELIKQSDDDAVDAIALHLEALVDTRLWSQLPTVFHRLDDLSFTQARMNKIDQRFMEQLAFSPTTQEASDEELDMPGKFIKHRFWNKEERWLPLLEREVSIAVAGAAMERTRSYGDAVDYYYWITKQAKLNQSEYDYFDRRIAACMQQQADIRHQLGKPAEQEERKLEDIKRKLGIDFIDAEPDPGFYPGDDVLAQWKVRSIREAQKPESTAESDAKKEIRKYSPKHDEAKWLKAIKEYAVILAEQGKWHTVAQNWCEQGVLKKRFSDTSKTQREKALEVVIQAIIEPLAISESIEDLKHRDKVQLTNLLINQLKEKDDDQRNEGWGGCDRLEIDYDLTGACLERIAKHIDCLSFYEWALAATRTRRERKYMAERLIVVLERYAAYFFDENNPGMNRKGEALTAKAEQLREEHRIRDTSLPKYPEL